jgi:hypothetical protein
MLYTALRMDWGNQAFGHVPRPHRLLGGIWGSYATALFYGTSQSITIWRVWPLSRKVKSFQLGPILYSS